MLDFSERMRADHVPEVPPSAPEIEPPPPDVIPVVDPDPGSPPNEPPPDVREPPQP